LDRLFQRFASRTAAGSAASFAVAARVVVGWAVSGPVFEFSQTWQLIINTGTTIVTFLMVSWSS
jgi:low affinity Fe/Cu permease